MKTTRLQNLQEFMTVLWPWLAFVLLLVKIIVYSLIGKLQRTIYIDVTGSGRTRKGQVKLARKATLFICSSCNSTNISKKQSNGQINQYAWQLRLLKKAWVYYKQQEHMECYDKPYKIGHLALRVLTWD